MPAAAPSRVSIRTYQVGFGDCFLLSFAYGDRERHVLVDFGSTGLPKAKRGHRDRMLAIAHDIKARCGGRLDAVIATHRHKDHISGFATNQKGTGPGDIIRALKPRIVVQPWTEDPGLSRAARGPASKADVNALHALSLAAMNTVAESSLKEIAHLGRYAERDTVERLSFLGEDNLANKAAVANLMTMGQRKPAYVFHGSRSGLEAVLPGVKVHVLGPPTLRQSDGVRGQKAKDREYWQLAARSLVAAHGGSDTRRAIAVLRGGRRSIDLPIDTRWLIARMRDQRADQLLRIVRELDDAMNNTSLILLFAFGDKKLLFPGDAQIENWRHALAKPRVVKLLRDVNVYKVGHHGSLNATPKSLWAGFTRRKSRRPTGAALKALMSTLADKHGHASDNTEVPRQTLVEALRKDTDLLDTRAYATGQLYRDVTV